MLFMCSYYLERGIMPNQILKASEYERVFLLASAMRNTKQ